MQIFEETSGNFFMMKKFINMYLKIFVVKL